jgi:hypothetical protein
MWPNTFNKKCATISGWQGLGDFTAVREQLQKLRSSTTHRPTSSVHSHQHHHHHNNSSSSGGGGGGSFGGGTQFFSQKYNKIFRIVAKVT